jgi:hypothetical protein
MLIKYLVKTQNSSTLGLKYNPTDGEIIIGGHGTTIADVKAIMGYFSQKMKGSWTQQNKYRVEANCKEEKFFEALIKLNKDGVVLQSSKSLERIMR